MLNIKLICVGKLKEKFYLDAEREYLKRLSGYCKLDIEELPECRMPDRPSSSEIEAALLKEAALIEGKLPKGALLISMCIEGEQQSSENIANLIQKFAVGGDSKVCFIIGGSEGLHESIKAHSQIKLSMSKMTFPHHLARIMLLEQIYRGFKIIEGGKYHK